MPKALPDRFLKADPDCPCDGCNKVRKTCRHCEKCKDCCNCPICPWCGGAEPLYSSPNFIKDVGEERHCEPCTGKGCRNRVDSWDPYGIDDNGDVWCDKCGPKHFGDV